MKACLDVPSRGTGFRSGPGNHNMDVIRKLRRNFQRVFARAKLPTSPAVASRILALMKEPDSSAADFGSVIRADPALAARLLKTANCALYAQRTPVTTIDRAVTVLGLERVKTLSLGFQLVMHLDRLGEAPFDMPEFWRQALLRACLARAIAEAAAAERTEEAFLIGLLQDCGVLLLVQVLDSSYGRLYASSLSPSAFFAAERETFAFTHLDAIGAMAEEWQLPEDIAMPLRRHHYRVNPGEEASDRQTLIAVSHFVGSLCFESDSGLATGDAGIREFGEQMLGLDVSTWCEVQKQAEADYRAIATLYMEVLPRGFDVAALMREANHYLSLSAEESNKRTAVPGAAQPTASSSGTRAATPPSDAAKASDLPEPDPIASPPPASPEGGNPVAALIQLAQELDARPATGEKPSGARLRKPCALHYFTGRGSQIGSSQAVMREIATDRIRLLIAGPLIRGEAVEVTLATGADPLFLAGPVLSCTQVRPQACEAVVQLAHRSKTALISGNAERFLRENTWATDALRRKQEGQLAPAVPA